MRSTLVLWLLIVVFSGCSQKRSGRKNISLNGIWEFSESGSFDKLPVDFKATARVPGLVDMAYPAPDTAYRGKVYWYRKLFKTGDDLPEVAILKIYKSMYHTKVFLNRKPAGENFYCFTPSLFDVRCLLNPAGVDNELIIGVGCYKDLPDTVVNGHDYEKLQYIPGIYDNVELQLTGYPFIANIQTAPDLKENKCRIRAVFESGGTAKTGIKDFKKGQEDLKTAGTEKISVLYTIKEVSTGKVVAQGDTSVAGNILDFEIAMPGCTWWSPENPFLYELELNSGGDNKKVKFGMRSFRFDKDKGLALLNGRPYYMRGTNICINRFFEDSQRASLPWDDAWVDRLHAKFKSMHWNAMRYCIGIPPERWYEIADSIGFLIQNEFPVWDDMRNVKAPQLTREYTSWMQEQWNHPAVVIWDAQNETVSAETGKAIRLVRQLDLSDRPWDNGWSPPQAETDDMECHPYLTYSLSPNKDPFKYPWSDIYDTAGVPRDGPNVRSPLPDGGKYHNPIVIDEYEWAWLNRDGSPTTLTDSLYNVVLGNKLTGNGVTGNRLARNGFTANGLTHSGNGLTKDERYALYARILSMDTEYWRAHRKCAAVMYFTGLGYSRPAAPRGQTSDNFIDVPNLIFEPHFEKSMKPAFAPVGLMIDIWKAKYKRNADLLVPVYVINDTYTNFGDTLKLSLRKDDKIIRQILLPVSVKPLGQEIYKILFKMPDITGKCTLMASVRNEAEEVTSQREFDSF